jgi:dienelactone hydrolase
MSLLFPGAMCFDFDARPPAPHSFFDRRYEEHAEASEDAWRPMLGLLERHIG